LEMESAKRMKVEEKWNGLEKNKIAYKGKFKQLVKKNCTVDSE
jgi:hypothetical protein